MAIYVKLPTVPPTINVDGVDQLDWSKPSVAGKVKEMREFYQVPLSQVLGDEDGVGGGCIDLLHCKGFMGGRKPFPMPRNAKIKQNYYNLRAQCCYKLTEYVNARKISIPIQSQEVRDQAIAELEQIKAKSIDQDDKPLQIVGKDEIKERIGRSPDLADNFMMRMFFEISSRPSITWL